MQSTDRDEFKSLLAVLCAAYDRPHTDEREEAYWRGLAKMSVSEFARVVTWCVGENGPNKLPTTKACWLILRTLKSNQLHPQLPKIYKPPRHEAPDNLLFLANRLMLAHIASRGGLGSGSTASQELLAALKFKRELVLEFVAYVREGDQLATRGEFIRRFVLGIDRVSRLAETAMRKFRDVMRDQAELLDRPMELKFVAGISATAQFDFGDYADDEQP